MTLQLYMKGTVTTDDGPQAGFITALLSDQALIHVYATGKAIWVTHDAFTPDGSFENVRAD